MDSGLQCNEFKLQAVNTCRLFHGITFPSEMLHYDEVHFNHHFLFGKYSQRSRKVTMTWPTQPLPYIDQWTTLRQFIRTQYLDGNDNWRLRLHPWKTRLWYSNNTIIESLQNLHNTVRRDQSIHYYVPKLPKYLQSFVQV